MNTALFRKSDELEIKEVAVIKECRSLHCYSSFRNSEKQRAKYNALSFMK
jgi:hypothetical protein